MNLRSVCILFLVGCSSSTSAVEESPAPPPDAANGTLEAWQSLGAMPTPRANHCAVFANGYLVVIGGNYKPDGATAFQNLDSVHVAKVAADGSLGAWQLAGKTPSPVNSCTAAADGNDIVLVDGIYDDDTLGGTARRATLSSDGVLGDWQDLGTIPQRVLYSTASIANGVLRAAYARLQNDGDGIAVLQAPLGAAGFGEWQDTKWLSGFRGHPQYAFSDSVAYAIGGYSSSDDSNTVMQDAEATSLPAAQGSFTVTALPKPTAFGQAAVVDKFLFVVGGKNGVLSGSGQPDVVVSPIAADGSLGAWTTLTPLPEGRTSLALTLAGDFLYATGGGFDAGGLATVYGARVRFSR